MGKKKASQNTLPQQPLNILERLYREYNRTVVVIRLKPDDSIRDYRVQEMSEVVTELHLNGFSEGVQNL